jgi:hypothetical protein
MTEIPQRPEKEVTPDNLVEIRRDIASLREQKGKDQEALNAIRWAREGAKRIGAHEDVVDLYWEEYLVGKHMVMEARDKEGLWQLPPKAKGIAEGYLLMKKAANSAVDYIDNNNVEGKKPRSGRFLGEIAMFERRYGKATDYFKESVELFKQMEDWRDRVNALELKGFLAEAMIFSGEAEKGVALTRKTFLEYDEVEAARLRDGDYYTWAVWKSGCVIKAWHALLAKDIPVNRDLTEGMVDMLIDVESVFGVPEGVEIWGDFSAREQEVASIKRAIRDRGFNIQ